MNLRHHSYCTIEHRLLIIRPMKFHITVNKVVIFFTMLICVHSRSAMIITTLDTFTSLLAGCTVFSILGNLSHEMGTDVADVVKGGPGLAFVSYPDAITKFDAVPQVSDILYIRVR